MGMSRKEIARRYRERNRAAIRAYDRAKTVSSRADRRAWLDAYKVEKGCADCGYDAHPRALDFDHIEGEKHGDVGRLAHHRIAWDRLMAEIAKCEVVCANCHRIRTYEREQLGVAKTDAPDVEQLDLFGEATA